LGNYSSFTNRDFFNIALYVYETNLSDMLRIDGYVALRRHPGGALFQNLSTKRYAFSLLF
jgi:hypothetical protein